MFSFYSSTMLNARIYTLSFCISASDPIWLMKSYYFFVFFLVWIWLSNTRKSPWSNGKAKICEADGCEFKFKSHRIFFYFFNHVFSWGEFGQRQAYKNSDLTCHFFVRHTLSEMENFKFQFYVAYWRQLTTKSSHKEQ